MLTQAIGQGAAGRSVLCQPALAATFRDCLADIDRSAKATIDITSGDRRVRREGARVVNDIDAGAGEPFGFDERDRGGLVLLRHKLRLALQHGHRWRLLARAMMRRRRMVAIEFGTCRSGRIGGASGSITVGNGRFLEDRGGTWC